MARDDLIRPVQTDAGKRRQAAGFAVVTGVLLVVLGVAMVVVFREEERPAALANGASSLRAEHEAMSAANNAESDVATFLAAMKAQKAAPKQSDAHALDWNWAPELSRDKSVRNWVGSEWVKPLAGDREIKQIAAPKFGAGADRLAAAFSSAGLASKVTRGKAQLPQMPSLAPLQYFPSKGSRQVGTVFNTR
jgi:hypothetical protein